MGRISVGALKRRLAGKAPNEAIVAAHAIARRAATHAADLGVNAMQGKTPAGTWLLDGTTEKDPSSKPDLEAACFCGCCDSVFSLKAYLFDLLDLLAEYWEIDLLTVERVLMRSFGDVTAYNPFTGRLGKADLTCELLNAPLPQARIACEILERYLDAVGRQVNSARWPEQFVDGLLRLVLPHVALADLFTSDPLLAGGTHRLTIAKAEAAALSPRAAVAVSRWKTELAALDLDLPGIDYAISLLEEEADETVGFEPDKVFAARREATMRQWLVDYRSALTSAAGVSLETLEASLFISLDSGGCRTTTRLQELLTSVQQIIESIRSGEIADLARPDLPASTVTRLAEAVTLPLSESAWVRLRDFETWLGYMYGWVYPENVLSVLSTDAVGTRGFLAVAETLQSQPLDAPLVRSLYLDAVVTRDLAGGHSILRNMLAAHKRLPLSSWKSQVDGLRDALWPDSDEGGNEHDRLLWFPLAAGLLLNRHQQFAAAHEWYRLLYDPDTRTAADILHDVTGVILDERLDTDWLDDPFEPVAIANRRAGVWLRHTILQMVANILDWADDEFARGLPDTSQRAEQLYELARKVLQAPALSDDCSGIVADVIVVIANGLNYKSPQAKAIARPLGNIRSGVALRQADKAIRKAVRGRGSEKQKRRAIEQAVARAVKADYQAHPELPLRNEYAQQRALLLDHEHDVFGKPWPGLDPGRPFDEPAVTQNPPFDYQPPPTSRFFCIPPNPVLRSHALRISAQLDKLRRCLDFMGEPQAPRVYGCDTYDAATGGINRPIALFDEVDVVVDQPRYRYNFLIEKARQYVDVAQRMGTLLLQALQQSDNEAFGQLQARHAIELADATVALRRLAQTEAGHGVEIATLQQTRAAENFTFWDDRVEGRPPGGAAEDEKKSLELMEQALGKQNEAAMMLDLATLPIGLAAGVGAGLSIAGAGATATGVGAPVGVPALALGMGVLAGTAAMLPAAASARQAEAGALNQEASLLSQRAAMERRDEEWKLQRDLAEMDSQIAGLQVALANDRLAIAGQELAIAQLQLSHAGEALRFLETKVTNKALYDWMIRVLSRDYRTLMQIASCVARLAQRAVEFERQEAMRIIAGDYWNIAHGALAASDLTLSQRRLGLLGAERLLTDLTKLDAYKLATDKRRLQITQTFSLSRMMPAELLAFRRSGVISFNTLLNWFDDAFQGHYLRLIKSVRVSVLALVPPLDGIHAMLHNTGESSVVVPDNGEFVERRAARNFGESIALDSAFNETGLFVLNQEDPMLLPFEGLGVQTRWTLDLPRASNRFNFDTIADVFFTIDYTAEYSRDYEATMRASRADVDVVEDTALTLRTMFPDLWYHLKNQRPDASGNFTPFRFTLGVRRSMFAPQLEDPITVEHLTLLVTGALVFPADQQVIENAVTIRKGSTTLHSPAAKAFAPGLAGGEALMLTTRDPGSPGLASHPAIGATDEWTIEFGTEFFTPIGSQPALVDRIRDVMLIVTIEGRRA